MKEWKSRLGISSGMELMQVALLMLFSLECVIGGAGRLISFGYVSLRMILFAVCFCITLPEVWKKREQLLKKPYFWIWVCFFAMLIVNTIYGWRCGNQLSFIRQDLTTYMTLALYPGFIVMIDRRERWSLFIDLIFGGAILIAVLTVAVHYLIPIWSEATTGAFDKWINDTAYGGLALFNKGFYRIYFKSQMFLQVGCMIGLEKLVLGGSKRKKAFLLAAETGMVYAMILSYTRGFWAGMVISCVLILILNWRLWNQYLKCLVIVGLGLVLMFGLSWVDYGSNVTWNTFAERFDSRLIMSDSDLDEESGALQSNQIEEALKQIEKTNMKALKLREDTKKEHAHLIKKKPFVGYGLGKNLDGIRTDGRTEYTYIDTYMKMGFVGMVLFVLTFGAPLLNGIVCSVRRKNRWIFDETKYVTAAYFGLCLTSYVNPFINTPMGILVLLTVIISVDMRHG